MQVFLPSVGFLLRTGGLWVWDVRVILLTVGTLNAGALGEQAALFSSIIVSRVSPIGMNQSSVKAALFPVTGPVSSCFLNAFGSRDHAGKFPRFWFYVTVSASTQKILVSSLQR